jgi:hypothetical protein
MCCSKKKFAPKTIPIELDAPLGFSLNETNFTMRNFEGIKSDQKNLAKDYEKAQFDLKKKIDLIEELSNQGSRISERTVSLDEMSVQTEKQVLIDLIHLELKKSVLIDECLKYEQIATGNSGSNNNNNNSYSND